MMTSTFEAFVFAARNALSFLEVDHGFTVSETNSPCELRTNHSFYEITYRKILPGLEELFVCLATAPARLERDLECGRGWPPEYHNTMNVFELLAIELPGDQIEFASGIYDAFGDRHKMSDQYTALANVLRNHGGRFFANDQSLWDAVLQLRESRIQQCEREETSRAAESAFNLNEWQRAIELLDSLGDNRTKLQTARLVYALKRVAQ